MGFKKIQGSESEITIETKITDGTGRLLSRWRTLIEQYAEQVKIINDKFNLGLVVKRVKDKDRDLEWLK